MSNDVEGNVVVNHRWQQRTGRGHRVVRLNEVSHGYRAMNEREATKVMIEL